MKIDGVAFEPTDSNMVANVATVVHAGESRGLWSSSDVVEFINPISDDPACRRVLLDAPNADTGRCGIAQTLSVGGRHELAFLLAGVFSMEECIVLMHAAEQWGFQSVGEQDSNSEYPSPMSFKDQ